MARHNYPQHPEPIDLSILRPPFAPVDEAEEWLFGLRRLGIRPGLSATHELLAGMGHPERELECIVVAGTNGKGSCATALAALIEDAGQSCGLYTSPHLLSLRERLRINGQMISTEQLSALVREHRSLLESTGATFFECLTALCLRHFADEGVEVAVLEAGLGGRLDATNAVDKVAVLLTTIAMDHEELLGSDLRSIAKEKLGLAAPSIPFYLLPLEPELHDFCRSELGAVGAEPIDVDQLVPPTWIEATAVSSAAGNVQREQLARVAACHADLARRREWPQATPASLDALRLAGRYQSLGSLPQLILDTAHNAQALEALLRQWTDENDFERRILVFASMRDKSIEPVLPLLARSAARIVVTAPGWYRATAPAELAEQLRAAAGDEARIDVVEDVGAALEFARELAGGSGDDTGAAGTVLLTGSCFLVAEALDRLGVDSLDELQSDLWDAGVPLRRRDARAEAAEA
jgi:dihydrofolate synthase/folylpolyglutamate synthase